MVVAPAGAWWAEAATRSTPCTSSCGGFQNQKNPGSKIFSTSHCERGVGLTEARKYIQQPILQFSNKTTNKTFAKFISNNANLKGSTEILSICKYSVQLLVATEVKTSTTQSHERSTTFALFADMKLHCSKDYSWWMSKSSFSIYCLRKAKSPVATIYQLESTT